jgi:hypothetical protein
METPTAAAGMMSAASDAAALFARHLDLEPLRGRSRGVVRCRFHDDRRPSLSVDLTAGVFNCFGCGEHGGVRRFAELVGEHDVAPRVRRVESPLQEARRAAARRARRDGERAVQWADWRYCEDFVRRSWHAVDHARRLATVLGPDHPLVWPALELAARVEQDAFAVEAELDAILASGRVA